MKQPAIFVLAAGMVAGVGTASFGWKLLIAGTLVAALPVLAGRVRWLFLLAFLIGCGRILLAPLSPPPDDISHLAGRETSVTGTVREYPEIRGDRQRAIVEAESGNHRGWILAQLDPYPRLAPGDHVELRGRLIPPPVFPDFDYRAYLAKDGIHAMTYRPEAKLIGHRETIERLGYRGRSALLATLGRLFPEPEASFLAGVLIGERSGLPDSVQSAFQRTGTTHVLALSGYNISVILGVTIALFGRRPTAITGSLAFLLLFVLFVGPTASVTRAALMGGFLLLGQALGRPQAALAGCLLTGAGMLLVSPWSLRYDLGFDLSFLATAGILLLQRPLSTRLRRLPRLVREPTAVTLAASLPTAPLIVLSFGTISLISPLANLLTVPLIPWLMLGGFLAAVTGLVSETAASGLAWLTTSVTRLLLDILSALSDLPLASMAVPFRAGMAVLMAVAIGGLLLRLGVRRA